MKHVVFFAIGILLLSCGKKPETSLPTVGPITESIYASGVLKTTDQYQAFVTVNGIVNEVLVQEGDSVHIGSPLLTITNETQRFSAENAALAANFNDLSANQGKLDEAKLVIETAKNKFRVDSSLYYRQKNLWSRRRQRAAPLRRVRQRSGVSGLFEARRHHHGNEPGRRRSSDARHAAQYQRQVVQRGVLWPERPGSDRLRRHGAQSP